ncbi:MAG: MCE family protein, partial [Planctomycetota bacterium]
MSEKHVKINLWVGIYSFVILVLSALFIIFFLGKMNPFTSSITVVVLFDNVEGLKIGSNVNLEGLTIGRVVSMRLAKDTKSGRPRHEVYIKIANRPEYLQWITRESKFQIVNDNFFGDKHVEVGFSTVGKPIAHMDRLEGTQTASINEILRNLQRITNSTEELIHKASALTTSFQSGHGSVLDNLEQTISNLTFLSNKIKSLFGPKEEKSWKDILSDLQVTIQNTKGITQKID